MRICDSWTAAGRGGVQGQVGAAQSRQLKRNPSVETQAPIQLQLAAKSKHCQTLPSPPTNKA